MQNITLNMVGLKCPEPIMLIMQKLRPLKKGDLLKIEFNDTASIRDIELLCHHNNHVIKSKSKTKKGTLINKWILQKGG